MELKAHGAMFHFPLVTEMSGLLIDFLAGLKTIDREALELCRAFYTSMHNVVVARIEGNGGKQGQELIKELHKACRLFKERRSKSRGH